MAKAVFLYGSPGVGKTELGNVLIEEKFEGGYRQTTQVKVREKKGFFGGLKFVVVDCTGLNHSQNEAKIAEVKKQYDLDNSDCKSVYVFDANKPSSCDRSDLDSHKRHTNEFYCLGTHRDKISSDEYNRWIKELQSSCSVNIFDLTKAPYSDICSFLGL
ncbi:hypothetical protein NHP190003_07150 [Helicobacter sp. NHP19-003]|uniref:G domain-containing protein n=1 Tax=Helicobacter gastrocanis TaxID=2849641 RepID=A0ABM7SA41_9HELI|nr:GTPase [Helicobacter sp. NHP19-003]BCZ17433.1 hypothetical protein NHP190003_07150 [Helicobacter sp. NHP19-003]